MSGRSKNLNTVLGFLAVLFWSANIGMSRALVERVGAFTAGSSIYLLAGALGCIVLALRPGRLREVLRLPLRYLLVCGALCVIAMVCLYVAVGIARNNQQVVGVALINYLWPSLTMVLSVPILKYRARPGLAVGVIVAVAGSFLGTTHAEAFAWSRFAEDLLSGATPYLLALAGAVAWALYSNLSRRWAPGGQSGGAALFLLASGLVMLALRLNRPEQSAWSLRAGAELACIAVFPGLLSYAFWDAAMRGGRVVLVASVSYLTPLLGAVVLMLYLGTPFTWNLVLACALVMAGAVTCRLSVAEREPAE